MFLNKRFTKLVADQHVYRDQKQVPADGPPSPPPCVRAQGVTGGAAPTVVITNIGTGETLRLTTSTSGTFSAPVLDPVQYKVSVEAQGFKTSVIPKVKVDT